jgi:hypothetical protein
MLFAGPVVELGLPHLMTDDREQLFVFEEKADEAAAVLPLWNLPLRSVLSTLFLTADGLSVGGRFERVNPPNQPHAEAILSRISYVTSLLSKCPLEIGADLNDALSIVGDSEARALRELVVYAHFSELMPEVRRGYYRVERVDEGFRLEHADATFASYEERDILVTELSRAFNATPSPHPRALFDRLIVAWPKVDPSFMGAIYNAYQHYLKSLAEDELLPDNVLEVGFGFGRNAFLRVRACLLAVSDLCIGMADAAERRALASRAPWKRRQYEQEWAEWMAPLLKSNFVLGLIEGVTGVPNDDIDAVLRPFIMDAQASDFGNAGEGFLPPLVRIGEAFLFSPYGLRSMLPERNLLYVLNKRDRKTFDTVVSEHLEPKLLDQAVAVLDEVPSLIVEKNVAWKAGEIDLVAYDPDSNSALHVQAKAAIPPQGARMTQQVQKNTLKAVEQLDRFTSQPSEVRDAVCSRLAEHKVTDVHWTPVILSRSGLGTARSWSVLGDAVPVNIALLRGTIRQLQRQGRSLSDFTQAASDLLDGALRRSVRGWRYDRIELFGTSMTIPLLDLDHKEMIGLRRDLG